MSAIVHRSKSTHPLSPSQKTFNRLKKKIETLQKKLQQEHQQLDLSLVFYQENIQPAQKKWFQVLSTFVKLAYEHYKKPKQLSAKEREILKDLMLDKINNIFSSTPLEEHEAEMRAIFEDLSGLKYQEMLSEGFNNMKHEIEDMFKENGVDVDLSHINLTENTEDIERQFFDAMLDAKQKMEELEEQEEEPVIKPKTKKQLQKEAKAQELEQLQQKGIGTIYKQLAKVFHPDLEPSPERKAEKEQLMKQLTSAYENNDLHTLLRLEMEWMNSSEEEAKAQSDELLKIYNSILKEQAATLQESIEMAFLHPKYILIQSYAAHPFFGVTFVLEMTYNELREDLHDCQNIVKSLQSPEGTKIIREIIREYRDT